VLVVALRVAAPGFVGRLSLLAFDFYQRAAPRQATDLPIRIVDIDEKSLRAIGQWPWPRTVIAELVRKLGADGAAVIAFDIVFAERDRTSPRMLLPLIGKSGPQAQAAERLLAALPDPDRELAQAIAGNRVATGFLLSNHGGNRSPAIKAGFAFAGLNPLGHVANFTHAIANLPEIEEAAAGNGFLNQSVDFDDVVRRVPLLYKLDGKPVPSLVAEVLRVVQGATTDIGRAAGANTERSFGQATGLTDLRIGRFVIPTDAAGRVWLHYSRPQKNRFVSAVDVLDGKLDRSLIKDNVVFVGTSAEGLVNDRQATPIEPSMPGVEIHAQLLGQILEGDYLVRPDWAPGAEVLFTALAGVALIYLTPALGALGGAAVGAVAVSCAVTASWLAFRDFRLLFDPVYPILALTLVYLLATLIGHLRTEARQKEIRRAFSRYMSPHYVAELAAHPERLVLGGETRRLTIMFCDIRGFTSLSEKLDAAALTHFMNAFLTPMTEIITERKGTIDKYIGDCIMAFWNAPLEDARHEKNALLAATAMRGKLVELNALWRAEPGYRSFLPVRVGIGINSGACVVGNFGSQEHFDYSVLGDPVNLASRLESLAKLYGVDLVIGEETARALGEFPLVELDLVAVKGKKEAAHVYTLPADGIAEADFADRHRALLAAYRRQDWGTALGLIEGRALAAVRPLAPLYDLYKRRIAHFRIDAPPENWDGVFTAEEK
jgi:adenylate cyclase